jgi:hypothetical protein
LTVATAAGLVATVDVAHEGSAKRIGPRTDDADLRVWTGTPLRLALVIGRENADRAAARAAALGACADIVLTLAANGRESFIERATAIREANPDAVLVVSGGRDQNGVVDVLEALRAATVGRPKPPVVLIATDERTRARIAASVTPLVLEAIPGPTAALAREGIVARLRGMRRPAGDIVLRDEAVEAAARAIAASDMRDTLVLDVSGASTSLALATPTGALIALHSHLGVGTNADRVVARAGLDRVRRWVPRAVDGPALLERVFNRARWPDAVPATTLTLALEMALAREAVSHTLRDAERSGISVAAFRSAPAVVCTGRIASFPRPAQCAIVAIDALEPSGTTRISREIPDALIAAGAIASRGAADVAGRSEALAVALTLWPRRPTAITVSDASGTIEQRLGRGALILMPTTGRVDVRVGNSSERVSAESLTLGVIIDARGRPLELPQSDAERLPALARWHSALTALSTEGLA